MRTLPPSSQQKDTHLSYFCILSVNFAILSQVALLPGKVVALFEEVVTLQVCVKSVQNDKMQTKLFNPDKKSNTEPDRRQS